MQSLDCDFDGDIMIYRARIEGTFKTDSGSLLTIIEEWVGNDGVRIIVTGVEMKIDRICSSFNDNECSKEHAMPSQDSSSYTAIITGGVVAVLIMIISVVIVLALVLIKCHRTHGDLAIKNPKHK